MSKLFNTDVSFQGLTTYASKPTFNGANGDFGMATTTGTLNFGAGAIASGQTKTVNIGTGGVAGSTTVIVIGAAAGTQSLTINAPTSFGATGSLTVKDSALTLQDDADPTKQGQFQLSTLTTGTTRVYTWPDKNGTVAMLSDITGGVSDGDKGDVVVSGAGTVWSLDFAAVNPVIAPVFANLTSKPTTVAGYGITDAVTTSGNQTVAGVKSFSSQITMVASSPSGPADGSIWHDSAIEGLFGAVGTRMRDLLADFATSRSHAWVGWPNGTSFANFGVAAPSLTGTATAASVATTNRYSMIPRMEVLVTTAAATAVAGMRSANTFVTIGGASADLGGFRFSIQGGPATGVGTTTSRFFMGIGNSVAAPTDVEPSSILNSIGLGYDAADTNLQIMRNDGTGTATKTDLGSSFPVPTTDRAAFYKLELFSPKGTTQIVYYRVTDMVGGAVATGSVNTDLPSTTTLLGPRIWSSVGGTSSVTGIAFGAMYLDPMI